MPSADRVILEGMSDHRPWDDAHRRTSETRLRRRRLLAAVVTVAAFTAVAGGSALGAVASAHEDAAGPASHQVLAP
jgi:hypothetical protein